MKNPNSIFDVMPTFPKFTKFSIALKDDYNKFYAQFPPYSDFSFGNLIIWLNQFRDLEISNLNGNIVYRFTNLFMDEQPMISLLGNTKIDQTLKDLLEYQISIGHPPEISMVPETIKTKVQDIKGLKISEEHGNANYILDTEKLTILPGTHYGKLRRQYSRFTREYCGRYEIKTLDIRDNRNACELVNGIHAWDRLYTKNDQERHESRAINTSLQHAKHLEMSNISVYIDGKLEAIALYQILPQHSYVIGNHTKANLGFKYLFNFTVLSMAKHLHEEGYPYINYEQDLDIPGLKEQKMGLRPINFLKHYKIEIN
ncbi:DUF2156 domain-containing protein [Candidatus Nomurabacteria bacterium]|jgi:hypothetical protein|nr:DUF2156 domain-containing protein [Candidatus Saccharibacteria bacterium]MCB9839347.1 DUF2156 domain-containing protein [Candidatus Nomurabacteria bacterium]